MAQRKGRQAGRPVSLWQEEANTIWVPEGFLSCKAGALSLHGTRFTSLP